MVTLQPVGGEEGARSRRRRRSLLEYVPTDLGLLVDHMPLDVEGAKLVLRGALCGLMEEAALLAALHATTPRVLKREPNKSFEYEELLRRFGPARLADPEYAPQPEDELLANLGAYRAWRVWCNDPARYHELLGYPACDPQRSPSPALGAYGGGPMRGDRLRLQGLSSRPELNGQWATVLGWNEGKERVSVAVEAKAGGGGGGGGGGGAPSEERLLVKPEHLEDAESVWCSKRSLSRTSLHAVARTAEHLFNTLYRSGAHLLEHNAAVRRAARFGRRDPQSGGHAQDGGYAHNYAQNYQPPPPGGAPPPPTMPADGAPPGAILNMLFTVDERTALRKLLQTLRPSPTVEGGGGGGGAAAADAMTGGAQCFFYARGCCSVPDCPFPHGADQDMRPLCPFAAEGRCRFGALCRDRHLPEPPAAEDGGPPDAHTMGTLAMVQHAAQVGLGDMRLFRSPRSEEMGGGNAQPPPSYLHHYEVLLLGEGDFTFGAHLAQHAGAGTKVVATSLQSRDEVLAAHPEKAARAIESLEAAARAGSKVVLLHGVDATQLDAPAVCERLARGGGAPSVLVWNFPWHSGAAAGEALPNHLLLRRFFGAAARWYLDEGRLDELQIHLTLGLDQFSDWNVVAALDDHFLSLKSIHRFEAGGHGAYAPARTDDPDEKSPNLAAVRTFVLVADARRFDGAEAAASAAAALAAATGGGKEGGGAAAAAARRAVDAGLEIEIE